MPLLCLALLRSFLYCMLQGRSWRRTAMHVQATVAERIGTSVSPYIQEPGKGLGFYTGTDGHLYVDNLRIDDIRTQVMACVYKQVKALSHCHDELCLHKLWL